MSQLDWSPQVLQEAPLRLSGGSIQVRGEWLLQKISAKLTILVSGWNDLIELTPEEQIKALWVEHQSPDPSHIGSRRTVKIGSHEMIIPNAMEESEFISDWRRNEESLRHQLLWELTQVLQAKRFVALAPAAFVGISLKEYTYLMEGVPAEQEQFRKEFEALFKKIDP